MLDFATWQLHHSINETNMLIENINNYLENEVYVKPTQKQLTAAEAESLIPKLQYLHKRDDGQPGAAWFIEKERTQNKNPNFNAEKAGLRQCIVTSYKDEAAGQEIQFPPGVIVNKINHRVFNYDDVQNKISELVNSGKLDCCMAIDIRLHLRDKLRQMAFNVIDMLSFPLKLNKTQEIDKLSLQNQYMKKYRENMAELRNERMKASCGNCGGRRSSGITLTGTSIKTTKPQFAAGRSGGIGSWRR